MGELEKAVETKHSPAARVPQLFIWIVVWEITITEQPEILRETNSTTIDVVKKTSKPSFEILALGNEDKEEFHSRQ